MSQLLRFKLLTFSLLMLLGHSSFALQLHSDLIEVAHYRQPRMVCIFEYGAYFREGADLKIAKPFPRSGYAKVYLTETSYKVESSGTRNTVKGWISKKQILLLTGKSSFDALSKIANSKRIKEACFSLKDYYLSVLKH